MGMTRSENMRRIRSKDTKPEILVRAALRRLGFSGYRLHRKELPGRPDIVFMGRRKAIFVHGCFWHRHSCSEGRRVPKSNTAFWETKISGNACRDMVHLEKLNQAGWDVLTIWDCELRNLDDLEGRLRRFLAETLT